MALLIAGLAVFGTLATLQATTAAPQQGAVLAANTDPGDPVGWCYITRACTQ
ncbi:hypothetical protein ACQEVB_04115 [Pseudonocardia sp. CA-107938]|uniref:hypothetical protein n=1 Tax=Pseudonocardia sp. CA-107938 TaxID=3240021 RepID=UPI003D8C0554